MKKPSQYDARLRAVSEAIDKVEAPGDYFATGVYATFPLPGLVIDGFGDVSVPLTDASAHVLIAASHLAPFGHGEQTLVDTHVRNTWELSENQFRLENPAFSAFVKDQVAEACRVPLGIHASVEFEAKLHKLLKRKYTLDSSREMRRPEQTSTSSQQTHEQFRRRLGAVQQQALVEIANTHGVVVPGHESEPQHLLTRERESLDRTVLGRRRHQVQPHASRVLLTDGCDGMTPS